MKNCISANEYGKRFCVCVVVYIRRSCGAKNFNVDMWAREYNRTLNYTKVFVNIEV